MFPKGFSPTYTNWPGKWTDGVKAEMNELVMCADTSDALMHWLIH